MLNNNPPVSDAAVKPYTIDLDVANKQIKRFTRVERINVCSGKPELGSLLSITRPEVCNNCGAIAMQTLTYVWCESPSMLTAGGERLHRDYGWSVKHVGTSCAYCGDIQAG